MLRRIWFIIANQKKSITSLTLIHTHAKTETCMQIKKIKKKNQKRE